MENCSTKQNTALKSTCGVFGFIQLKKKQYNSNVAIWNNIIIGVFWLKK